MAPVPPTGWHRADVSTEASIAGPVSDPPMADAVHWPSHDDATDADTGDATPSRMVAPTAPDAEAGRGDLAGTPHQPGPTAFDAAAPLRLAHTDWLYHCLTITGLPEQLDAFQAAAAGAGTIPWTLDVDRMEEDFFLRLVASDGTQGVSTSPSRLSAAGARMLAAQLREAVARRHERAIARVGTSHACPLDLHALVPVPADVLRLGPDDPAALAWLWEHWGTTEALRHVSRDGASPSDGLRIKFWSADWTPWPAFGAIAARWPTLRFDLRAIYDTA